jgi:hypothetical protein
MLMVRVLFSGGDEAVKEGLSSIYPYYTAEPRIIMIPIDRMSYALCNYQSESD